MVTSSQGLCQHLEPVLRVLGQRGGQEPLYLARLRPLLAWPIPALAGLLSAPRWAC